MWDSTWCLRLIQPQWQYLHVRANLYVQEMPSFSLIMDPSLESITASVSPSAFFFKNLLRPAHAKLGEDTGSRSSIKQCSSYCVTGQRTFAQLAVNKCGCRRQRVGRVLKLAEGLELDNLRQTSPLRSAAA